MDIPPANLDSLRRRIASGRDGGAIRYRGGPLDGLIDHKSEDVWVGGQFEMSGAVDRPNVAQPSVVEGKPAVTGPESSLIQEPHHKQPHSAPVKDSMGNTHTF